MSYIWKITAVIAESEESRPKKGGNGQKPRSVERFSRRVPMGFAPRLGDKLRLGENGDWLVRSVQYDLRRSELGAHTPRVPILLLLAPRLPRVEAERVLLRADLLAAGFLPVEEEVETE